MSDRIIYDARSHSFPGGMLSHHYQTEPMVLLLPVAKSRDEPLAIPAKNSRLFILLVAFLGCLAVPTASSAPGQKVQSVTDSILRWNQIAIDATGLDHTPPRPGEARAFKEQFGPGRSSRAMAMVHIAMFEAANAVFNKYQSYTGVRAPNHDLSVPLAISQAARDTLADLFPAQSASFDAQLAEDLAEVKNQKQKVNGVNLGRRAAAALLELRTQDGSEHPEPVLGVDWFTSNLPGCWRMDPISHVTLALGAHWGECTPFVLASGSQFRAPPFPDLGSPAYALAYAEVMSLGGDGITTPTLRTPEQTFIGIFWAYDGTPSLCAPPRLYNQITVQIAEQMRTDGLELARLLALVNVAMADAAVGIWESKYYYDVWRPITGIRESDPGTGPTGLGDGNSETPGDPSWTPLGAPASNLTGPNFTPPFPSYPSGHGGFGGAVFQTLRRFYGTDNIAFTFVSDEFNGITVGDDGNVRPYKPRSFSSLSQAEDENGQSRIYLGIHWAFDKTESIIMGRQIADFVFDTAFRPLRLGAR